MVSGVSILNFSALSKRFSLLRSNIGLPLLLGFGTKSSQLKNPRDICLVSCGFPGCLLPSPEGILGDST